MYTQKRSMNTKLKKGNGIALGIIFGAALGIALENLGAWLAIGLAFGAGLEAKIKQQEKEIN